MKQKAAITLEQQETLVVHRSSDCVRDFCTQCEDTLEFVTPEIMAAMAGTSEREIFRLIEAGQVYFVEQNRIYACLRCYEKMVANNQIAAAGPQQLK